MNETIQTILKRRSIRKFSEHPVSRENLDLILKCGLYAPTGRNLQETHFIAIENRAILDQLSMLVRNEFSKMQPIEGQYCNSAIINAREHPHYDFSFHAPVLVIVTASKIWPNGMADSANALQNMQLAASSLGLGACWVNQLHWLTDNQTLRGYLEQYGVCEDEEIYGSLAVGHPAMPIPNASPRKENRVTYVM